MTSSKAQTVVDSFYKVLEQRIAASPLGFCPVDVSSAFVKFCLAQSCGKCTPCRIGLAQLYTLMESVMDGKADESVLPLMERTARTIVSTSDCAIGREAGRMVLVGLRGFRDDYLEHIHNKRCLCHLTQPVPCVAGCPAHVDIPGYIALVANHRYADAVRLIRKDNPFPTACALICEHPCETNCRRNMVDDNIKIRSLKRVACDKAGVVPVPECGPSTGKNIAIIGGGPSGLTAAYFLQLMGHQTTIFEQRSKLGGMLLYGIPSYRLPRERLQSDIDAILSTGVEVKLRTSVRKKLPPVSVENEEFLGSCEEDRIENTVLFSALREEYDAIYISIGAHTDNKLRIPGEDAVGVLSAVEMLRAVGNGLKPDFAGKNVIVVGGGNVAMDCVRSAIRLGAEHVMCVYRRRKDDMTAQLDEIDGAINEGASLMDLYAPKSIEVDENGHVSALIATKMMAGPYDRGRPKPVPSGDGDRRIPCDILVVAAGQKIESDYLEAVGVPTKWGSIVAEDWTQVPGMPGVFSGGDCVTGPSTVIRAIAAGKVAAANIDDYLGFSHPISVDVDVPLPQLEPMPPTGRAMTKEREPYDRKKDFCLMELPMSDPEAEQEPHRCLRCDYYGFGIFKGGRETQW